LFAPVLRGLERVLPAWAFCGLLYPVAWVRAFLHSLIKRPPVMDWPMGLPGLRPAPPRRLYRLPVYLNRTFQFIPDRMTTPKWRGYCQYHGLEAVLKLAEMGRPVVLAFAHFGSFTLLRNWLRAAGLPVSMFTGIEARDRPTLTRRKDRWALFPETPPAFHRDQLAEAIRHLKSGCPLAISIDTSSERQLKVPLDGGWVFQMPSGPVRLARRHGASLVPCSIYNGGLWRVVVEFGEPIKEERLAEGEEAVGVDLITAFLPVWLAHPEEWTPQLAGRFSRSPDSAGPDGPDTA